MKFSSLFTTLFFLTLTGLLYGCDSTPPTPDHRIRIKNDSQDSEFNILQVSGGGLTFFLKPLESGLLPEKTWSFRLSRRYKDHTKSYSVSCPVQKNSGIVIKLIDAHVNRMPGGCKTLASRKK